MHRGMMIPLARLFCRRGPYTGSCWACRVMGQLDTVYSPLRPTGIGQPARQVPSIIVGRQCCPFYFRCLFGRDEDGAHNKGKVEDFKMAISVALMRDDRPPP